MERPTRLSEGSQVSPLETAASLPGVWTSRWSIPGRVNPDGLLFIESIKSGVIQPLPLAAQAQNGREFQ